MDYYYIKNFLNKERISEINEICNTGFKEPEDMGASGKHSLNKIVHWSQLKPVMEDVEHVLLNVNNNYFGYNLHQINLYKTINYNIYSGNDNHRYDWHVDTATSEQKYDLKLTALVNLSDSPYVGGDFELNTGEITHIKEFSEPGDIILFKSYILHRVKPVTSGVRKSLAFFLEGPKFI